MKKKLNYTQRQNRRAAFRAIGTAPRQIWRGIFPVEEPVPITQLHSRPDEKGGIAIKSKVATTIAPVRDAEGNLVKDDKGRPIPNRVPVCRHRCAHVNMRHTAFNAPRPRDKRRAALA